MSVTCNECAAVPAGVLGRKAQVLLAAAAGIAVAYGYEVHPLLELGRSLPLSDMAPGLAQAFGQIGSVDLTGLVHREPH
jgi:hypothetical protein